MTYRQTVSAALKARKHPELITGIFAAAALVVAGIVVVKEQPDWMQGEIQQHRCNDYVGKDANGMLFKRAARRDFGPLIGAYINVATRNAEFTRHLTARQIRNACPDGRLTP